MVGMTRRSSGNGAMEKLGSAVASGYRVTISKYNLNNVFQLCLGMILGAWGMAVWMKQDDIMLHNQMQHQQKNNNGERQLKNGAEDNGDDTEGWHPIHVFYGEKDGLFNDAPKSVSKTQNSYAQVGQDSIVLDLLGDDGYFIDLAANDALDLTNTLTLERHGWNGLCVEPNPVYWYGLSHRKCTVIGAMVAGTHSEKVKVKFRGVYGGIVGRMDNKLAKRKKEPDAPEITRYTAPITDVLNKFTVPKTIDYLSLDVEGSEYEIMKDFPFEKYTIRVLTVERPNNKLKQLLTDKGYVYLAEIATWGEYLWCHKSTGFTKEHEKIKKIKPRT